MKYFTSLLALLLLFGATANVSLAEGFSASISSISNNSNPFVEGKAYNVDTVGFFIGDEGGGKAYGSGSIDVENNYWSHEISTDLFDGDYTLYLSIDNKEYDRKEFEISKKNGYDDDKDEDEDDKYDMKDENEDEDEEEDKKSIDASEMTNEQKLELIGSIFGKDSEIYQLFQLLILLDII